MLMKLITIFSLNWFYSVLAKSLPLVDPGLFVIQGVTTCGLGEGYCLLSNSCLVDTDFESDSDGGHCDGLKHAFNPNAEFVCCKFVQLTVPPIDIAHQSTTENAASTISTAESTAPIVISTSTVTENLASSELTDTTTPASETTTPVHVTVTPKRIISTSNIAANTNKLLNSIQHLLQGGRMQPTKLLSGQDGVVSNDKSLLPLILLGLNETLHF